MENLNAFIEKKRNAVDYYNEKLTSIEGIRLPAEASWAVLWRFSTNGHARRLFCFGLPPPTKLARLHPLMACSSRHIRRTRHHSSENTSNGYRCSQPGSPPSPHGTDMSACHSRTMGICDLRRNRTTRYSCPRLNPRWNRTLPSGLDASIL